MSDRTHRLAGVYARASAVAWAVLAPLLALAYFATEQGVDELEAGTVAAWAEPARDLAGSLLTFGSPDLVYAVYSLALAALFPAIALGAMAARSLRPAGQTRPERWGWRLAIGGYMLFGAGLALVALAMPAVGPSAGFVDVLFIATMIPGLLIGLIGSTVLGIALLRAHYRPRTTAWLLALSLPLWILGSAILGHNSLGLFPLAVAWALAAPAVGRAPLTLRAESA